MNTKDDNFKRYILILPVLTLLFLVVAGFVNYLIDPYGLFDTNRIEGLNKLKPKATLRVRIVKPYLVDKFNPDVIIAGNSRPEIGLNPRNICWIENNQSVFNLSLPGASVYMAARYVQHAIDGNDVKQVLWGLDFKDFLEAEEPGEINLHWPPTTESFEERLRVGADGVKNDDYFLMAVKDHLTLLFSLDALKDSFSTVVSQSQPRSPTIRRDGFNPAKDFLDMVQLEGHGLVFKQKNIDVVDMFFNHKRFLSKDIRKSWHFESVRQVLALSKKKNVETILFINPYHSDYLYTIYKAGLWESFLLWKKQLVELSAKYNIALYDFSGFNAFSNPQPPPLGNRKDILQWFWEPAHYRQEYGDFMIGTMLHRSCNASNYSDVGVHLTMDSIVTHNVDSDAGLMRFVNDYPNVAERLKLTE